ncbi:hypothetical protein FCV25MIE_34044 [Fagus crenata]
MIMASPVSTKVVYFLDTSMSKQLLCKFPDTSSAFDFDQTQSSIWSPLVPRIYSAMDYPKPRNRNRRRVSIGGAGMGYKLKKFTSNIKKKLNVTAFNLNLNLNPFNNNNKINPSHVSETPLKTTKAWTKALKATSIQFKKKKDPTAHVKLSTYLRGI